MMRQCTVTILLSLTTVAWAAEPLPGKVDYNRDIKPILSDLSLIHISEPTRPY